MKGCCSGLIRGLIGLAGLRKPTKYFNLDMRNMSQYSSDYSLLEYDAVFAGRGLPMYWRNVVKPFQGRSLWEYASPKPRLISTRLCGVTSREMVLLLCQQIRCTGGSSNWASSEYKSEIVSPIPLA